MMSWTTSGVETPITRRSNVPIDRGVMSVLSASTYTDQAVHDGDLADKKRMPMGFVVVTSSEDDDTSARPRKKSKTGRSESTKINDNSDDGGKKHRGRPRIDGQDETAVDRRRTQIRLAQRAYRNRKETTISTLKQQNNELQQSIARMTSVFKNLQDELTRSQALRELPNALQQLRHLKTELDHASTLTPVDDQDQKDSARASTPEKPKDSPVQEPQPQVTLPDTLQSQDLTTGRDSYGFLPDNPSMQKLPAKTQDITLMDMEVYNLDSAIPQSSYLDWAADPLSGPITELDQSGLLMGNWPNHSLTLERAFPQQQAYTYSFQETTFARRLHRFSLEKSFRILTHHDSDPGFLARTFRFTLFYLNKRRLREGMQTILQRKAGESLENFEVPYFHVGGAGTHFPRRDAVGTPIFPPNLQNPAKAPGPWQLVYDGDEVDSSMVQTMLNEMGYSGVWFDSHDVEQYLRSKGVYLDGNSSFVEIDTSAFAGSSEDQAGSTTSSAVPTLAASPSSSHSFANSSPEHGGNGPNSVGAGLNDQLSVLGQPATGLLSSQYWSGTGIGQGMAPDSPGNIPTFEQIISRKQGVVTFDVERFLERLADGGSCLGRAPGYRKATVDNALALAVQEAF